MIAFCISLTSFESNSWLAYHPKKMVGSPQNDELPLLTPNKAYCGDFFPLFIFPEDITL